MLVYGPLSGMLTHVQPSGVVSKWEDAANKDKLEARQIAPVNASQLAFLFFISMEVVFVVRHHQATLVPGGCWHPETRVLPADAEPLTIHIYQSARLA
jgi:hypothetical protein